SSVLIWVTANTNTRSQRSSTLDVRRVGGAVTTEFIRARRSALGGSAALEERDHHVRQLWAHVDVVVRCSGQDREPVVGHARAVPARIALTAAEQREELDGM